MQFKKRFLMVFMSLTLLVGMLGGGAPFVQAQEMVNSKTGAYEFSVKPGTEEWKRFLNFDEMLEACQVPEEILKNMSTTALVETVLNYPLLRVYMAHDDFQQGFEILTSNFNGLQELFNRYNAGTEVFQIYLAMDPSSINKEWTDVQKGSYALSFLDIEMLLFQEPILTSLTAIELQMLEIEAGNKNRLMQNNPEVYSLFNRQICASLLEQACNQYSNRYYGTSVYTPMGSAVAALQMQPGDELSPAEIASINAYYDSAFPYATRMKSATRMYNCHSYAWYSQEWGNTIWINAPNQATYWNDGSYSQWTGVPYVNLKVRYVNDDHSAIIYSTVNHQYISKWGAAGLYTHSPSHCPYVSTTLYYYSRN
ncbi:MAG: hypothetical protein P3T54_05355 [Dehalogenimonas sp.]|uniref:Uncharacterized protein n=1 Tax=Candidatus Dehalogenimonas loeffleri TaxID=3127115 RepID=A0ABZ2J8A2_9CHLR|nr:hypothetical protein [Dehalogenimonas sp.]